MTDSDQQGASGRRPPDRAGPGKELTGGQRRAERPAGIALGWPSSPGSGCSSSTSPAARPSSKGPVRDRVRRVRGRPRHLGQPPARRPRGGRGAHELSSGPAGRQAFGDALTEEVGPVGRRSMLLRLLVGAGAALGAGPAAAGAVAGPGAGQHPQADPVAPGKRVVDEEGEPVRLNQVPEDGFLTVFPEGTMAPPTPRPCSSTSVPDR